MASVNDTTPAPNPVRPPNTEERQLLAEWLSSLGYETEDAKNVAEAAYVSVFDRYQTGCPGYCGKVMSVVWDGSPSTFDVFIWENGKMVCSEREPSGKECDQCGEVNDTVCRNCWKKWAARLESIKA